MTTAIYDQDIDWNAMETLRVPPPMTPTVHHETDTQNFDDKFTRLPPSDLDCDDIIDELNKPFRGFSFSGLDSLRERTGSGKWRSISVAVTPLGLNATITVDEE